jgi:uncharacterized protein YdbL (DUF1318 family)
MTMMAKLTTVLAVTIALGAAGVAMAQTDPAVEAARASGGVGEQADGYLGFPTPPSASLKAAVDAVNIKRRAVYTDLAAKRNVTVQEVAGATACELLSSRVGPGQKYRTSGGAWQTNNGSVEKPSFCP